MKESFNEKLIYMRQDSYKVVELEQVQEQLGFADMVASLVHQLLRMNVTYPLVAFHRLKENFTIINSNVDFNHNYREEPP